MGEMVKHRSPYWARYSCVAVVGLVLACAQIWTRLQAVSIGYALSDARQLIQTLEEEQRTLEAEWSALTASGRLAEQATQRLRLVVPQPGQVLQLP